MAKTKKGFFTRLIEGPERAEDYARKTLPTNRWSLGWDLFTGNIGKIVKINLLMLIFLFPIFIVFYFRSILISGQALMSPFAQNLGIGYPLYPFLTGTPERIIFFSDLVTCILMLVLSFYFSVGLSGGFYVMRNLVWTEGVFVASDFWVGVKQNYKQTLVTTLLFVFFGSLTILSIDIMNLQIALTPSNSVILTIIKVFSYIFIFIFISVFMFNLSIAVTYKLKLKSILRNSLIFTIGLFPVNAFFLAFSFALFALLLLDMTSIFFSLGLMVIIFIAFSVCALIWTNYSQWLFDEFINDKIAGAKKYRGIYKKTQEEETTEFVYKKSNLIKRSVKPVTDYDIEIAELPESYSRADLLKLEESKKRMMEDSDRYAKEHENDYQDAKDSIDEFMQSDKEK